MVKAFQVSVVLLSSERIFPVNAEGLHKAGIVPSSWSFQEPIQTPVFSQIQYGNKVTIRTEGQRCVFEQALDGDLRDNYQIHRLAGKYISAMSLVPYTAIGLNWQLAIDESDSTWISEKLFKFYRLADFSPQSLRLAKQLGSSVCNLDFRVDDNVVVHCNYHFDVAGDGASTMIQILDGWQKYQDHLQNEISPQLV